MLHPAGFRTKLASCSGPLLVFSVPVPCNGRTRRKNSVSNQLCGSRRGSTQFSLRQFWPIGVQCSTSRANSSLARAKAALRKGHTPYQPAGKLPQDSVMEKGDLTAKEGDFADKEGGLPGPLLQVLSGLSSANERQIAKETQLTNQRADYYRAVAQHPDVLWLSWDEFRQVPTSLTNRYIRRPAQSRNERRYGVSLQNCRLLDVAGSMSDPNTRKQVVLWNQDTCKDLAPAFKKILKSRATLARLAGYNSYLKYMSQFKMLGSGSVRSFLDRLQSQIEPIRNAFMERLVEQKMKDLNYDFTIKEFRRRLRSGKTIRDYQLHQPEAQINWGDIIYYQRAQFTAAFAPKRPEDPQFDHYFSVDETITRLLKFFGNLLGLEFTKLPPENPQHKVMVKEYLQVSNITALNLPLDVFYVTDRAGFLSKPLGFLVLDLKERDRKARSTHKSRFCFVTVRAGLIKKLLPGVSIHATFKNNTSTEPETFSHSGLETFAHELGHAIHDLVRNFSNLLRNGEPRDFVEIPSTVAENWMSDPKVLEHLSCHYTYLKPEYLKSWKAHRSSKNLPTTQPPKTAPLELFSEIAYRRHPSHDLINILDLIWKSEFDYAIHSASEEQLKSMNLGMLCRKILEKQCGIFSAFDEKNPGAGDHTYLHWSTLKDYSTSTYCYLLAKVYSYDIWSKQFARDPFNKRAGQRWRKIVLEHVDVKPSWNPVTIIKYVLWKVFGVPRTHMEALTKFMGRKPNSRAFVRALKAPANKNQTFWRRMGIRMGVVW